MDVINTGFAILKKYNCKWKVHRFAQCGCHVKSCTQWVELQNICSHCVFVGSSFIDSSMKEM